MSGQRRATKSDLGKQTDCSKVAEGMPLILIAVLLLSGCFGRSVPVPVIPEVVNDGSNGAIVTWIQEGQIYTRKLSGEGKLSWEMPITGIQAGSLEMVPDTSGGAIIVWMDSRAQDTGSEDLYIQRISDDGRILWEEGGVPVYVAPGHQAITDVVTDDSGGAIVVWIDTRNDHRGIFAQRVDASGRALWGEDGVSVAVTESCEHGKAASDGSGGAVIMWQDVRGTPFALYAQHIDPQGTPLWQKNGVPMSLEVMSGLEGESQTVGDGMGGAVVPWAATEGVYAQRVNAEGQCLWQDEGVLLSTVPGRPIITADGRGGFLIAWAEMPLQPTAAVQSQWALYVQKLDPEGRELWSNTPVGLSSAPDDNIHHVQVVSDGSGGAIVVWRVGESISRGGTIRAQRLDAGGNAQWSENGILVYPEWSGYQDFPRTVGDNSGGVIIVSLLGRSSDNTEVYAQRIDSEGERLWPEGGMRVHP
jgi:hypothetical protein